jgi:hypothetical protein
MAVLLADFGLAVVAASLFAPPLLLRAWSLLSALSVLPLLPAEAPLLLLPPAALLSSLLANNSPTEQRRQWLKSLHDKHRPNRLPCWGCQQ